MAYAPTYLMPLLQNAMMGSCDMFS